MGGFASVLPSLRLQHGEEQGHHVLELRSDPSLITPSSATTKYLARIGINHMSSVSSLASNFAFNQCRLSQTEALNSVRGPRAQDSPRERWSCPLSSRINSTHMLSRAKRSFLYWFAYPVLGSSTAVGYLLQASSAPSIKLL